MQTRPKNFAETIEARTGGIDEACARYGLGKASMRKVAEDAGAIIRIGKRLLINYSKVDFYFDSISGLQGGENCDTVSKDS